jgi:hypothetical protein
VENFDKKFDDIFGETWKIAALLPAHIVELAI